MQSRWTAVAASIALVAALVVAPSTASAEDAPPPLPPSNGTGVFVDPSLEGTTVDRSSIRESKPSVSPQLQSKLQDLGLTGPLRTVQEGPDGVGTFYADDYAWVLDLGPSAPKRVASTHAFSFGFCTGYFNTPTHVSNYLQWGGQSSCSASNGQYYLHKVNAALYDTCIGPFCAILTYRMTATSPTSADFSSVATAYGAMVCVNGGGRTYEQKVDVIVRSVAYGPFWQRGVVVDTCSVAP